MIDGRKQSKVMKRQQQIYQEQQSTRKIRMLNQIFAVAVLIYQLAIGILYGFFITLPPNANNSTVLMSYIITALQFLLIVAAFGLLFNKASNKLSFSGIGFNLLIACLCVQSYFLWNAFWSKAEIQNNTINTFFTKSQYDIYLSIYQDSYQTTKSLGGNMNQALKCALSIIIAFSFLIGRIGPFEILIMSLFGTASYQLSRQIAVNANNIDIGSMKIFLFGGALGLGISMILKAVEGDVTSKHPNRQVSKNTGTTTLLGLVLAFALFPLLALDSKANDFTTYTGPLSVVYSMAAAGLTSFAISFWSLGKNMLVLGTLSGGVAVLSSSVYITNPVYALLIGNVSALSTYLLIRLDTFVSQRFGVLDSFGSYMFLAQGFLGCCWATMNHYIVAGYSNQFSYSTINVGLFDTAGVKAFGNGFISLGIGFATGLFLGVIFICFNFLQGDDYFTDRTYWDQNFGMKFEQGDRHIPFHRGNKANIYKQQIQYKQNIQELNKAQKMQTLNELNENTNRNSSGSKQNKSGRIDLVFTPGKGNIKGNHAYM